MKAFKVILSPIPGHGGSSLHDLVSLLVPGHVNPPFAGRGLVQDRDLFCVPPPQVREHRPQAFHAAQLPSTVKVLHKAQSVNLTFNFT